MEEGIWPHLLLGHALAPSHDVVGGAAQFWSAAEVVGRVDLRVSRTTSCCIWNWLYYWWCWCVDGACQTVVDQQKRWDEICCSEMTDAG